MSSEELTRKLCHAESGVTDLRSKIARLQKDVERKDKRLAKATSRSTKLEGLLMQTEGEAEQLRAKCAETEAAVAEAKRTEAALLIKLEETSSSFNREHDALIQKSDELSKALSQKLVLVGDLQSNVSATQELVQQREMELVTLQEEQQANERDILTTVSEKEKLVSQLQRQLLDEQTAHAVAVKRVSEQGDLHQRLLSEKEMQYTSLRSNLEDSTLAIFNLQLRLKEAHHDIETERFELQNALSAKEGDVASLKKLLDDKTVATKRLLSEAANTQSALEERNRALSETELKLQDAERSLAIVQQELSDKNGIMENEAVEQRKALVSRDEELSETKKLLAERAAAAEREMSELSQRHSAIQSLLSSRQEELDAVSSRLEISQHALQALQSQLSDTRAVLNDQVHKLEGLLSGKENELQCTKTALQELSFRFEEEVRTLTDEQSRSSALIEEKDSKVQELQQQMRHSEESLVMLKRQISQESIKHESREKELQTLLANQCTELESLTAALNASTKENQALQAAHETVLAQLHEAETNTGNTISLLEAQLKTAQLESIEAVSECAELHTRLEGTEKNLRKQSSEVEHLQNVVDGYKISKANDDDRLQALQTEKEVLEQSSLRYQEQISLYEVEKADVVEHLKVIHSERDELTASIEQLKQASEELVLEAQEDAAKQIADLSLSNEDLQMQVRKQNDEADSRLQQIQNLQQVLLETEREACESKKALEKKFQLEGELTDLREKLHHADVRLEQTNLRFQQLSEERAEKEVFLGQEIRVQESSLESKNILLGQLKSELATARAAAQDLETKNAKMKSAMTESNHLLLRASNENKELVNVLSGSQAEFQKTLESTSRMLKTSQRSEELSKSAYRLLLERLQSLKLTCGFGKQEDQTLPASNHPDLHTEVNLVIAQLEEHFHGGRYLEVELANVSEVAAEQKESNQSLLQENRELQSSLDETATKLRIKTEELNSLSKREKEAQTQLLVLREKLLTHEQSMKDISQGNTNLQKVCADVSEKLVARDNELVLISAREREANELVQQFRARAELAAENLADQERAAEVTLTSLQRRLKEMESEVSESSTEQQRAEQELQHVKKMHREACVEKDRIGAELDALREAHNVLGSTLKGVKCQLQKETEAVKARLKLSEEAVHHLQKSSSKALEEAGASNEMAEKRYRTAERERDELRNKLKDAVGAQREKHRLDVALREKEESLMKYAAELERLNGTVATLQAENSARSTEYLSKVATLTSTLEAKHLAEQRQTKEQLEKKYREASESEDKNISILKSELKAVEDDAESLRRNVGALREDLQSEKKSKAAEIASLERKLDTAMSAHEIVQKKKAEIEQEMSHHAQINDELAATIDELRGELASKGTSTSALSEKLTLAEVSIVALEAKVASTEATLVKNTQEHSAAVDGLISRLDAKQTELECALSLRKEGDVLSERSLTEIRRLEDVVTKLKEEAHSAKEGAAHFETLLDGRTEEMSLMQERFTTENESLHKMCTELSRKHSLALEEIQDGHSKLTAFTEKLEGAQNELVFGKKDRSRRDVEFKQLEEELEKRERQTEELRFAVQVSNDKLDAEVQALVNAQGTIAELSRHIAELERDDGVRNQQTSASEELEEKNTYLQRRGERLGVRSKKLLRRLKRVEKLLVAEKRKNQSLDDVSAKRQISPSTKGMSPAIKRIRDQAHREPLSPIASNARPPRAPKSSVRHLAF